MTGFISSKFFDRGMVPAPAVPAVSTSTQPTPQKHMPATRIPADTHKHHGPETQGHPRISTPGPVKYGEYAGPRANTATVVKVRPRIGLGGPRK